jgi:hypothetical protein
MSRPRLVGLASALLLLGSSGVAWAGAAYSYEIENADAHTDKVLVVWPRACGAKGEPLGTVDLALNPDWTSRMHDIDYEVVVGAKKHALHESCTTTARLYALPAAEFARGTREATADDRSIGQSEAGAPFAILPALDAIELPKRIQLFEKDARVLRTTFRFEPSKPSRPATLKAVHEVLEVSAFDATSFAVAVKRAIYTHEDGHLETVTDLGRVADASAPASAASAAAPVVPAEPAKPDLGTRWVLLAAVAGLVLGGVLAYRKKQKPSAK